MAPSFRPTATSLSITISPPPPPAPPPPQPPRRSASERNLRHRHRPAPAEENMSRLMSRLFWGGQFNLILLGLGPAREHNLGDAERVAGSEDSGGFVF